MISDGIGENLHPQITEIIRQLNAAAENARRIVAGIDQKQMMRRPQSDK